jgi:hypothetical protein
MGFRFSLWRFSIRAISSDVWFSALSIKQGMVARPFRVAALNLLSPAIISNLSAEDSLTIIGESTPCFFIDSASS